MFHQRMESYRLTLAWLFVAGLLSTAAIMTRPMFILVPFVLAATLMIGKDILPVESIWKRMTAIVLPLCLPAILTAGIWVNYVHSLYKVWGMDAIGGYHLMSNAGTFFELVPDEYAVAREIYLKHRAARLDDRGAQANTIWDAIPELNKALGTNYYSLSRLLAKISLELIRDHPDLFLLNVAKGWWWTWLTPVYWNEEAVTNPTWHTAISVYIYAARGMLFGANVVFLAISVAALFARKLRGVLQVNSLHWMLIGIVVTTSLVQAFAEHGDNHRYMIPLQSTVVFIVLLWLSRVYELFTPARR
jgi:hypothetical protein